MAGPDSPLAVLEALIFAGSGSVGPTALKRVLGWTPGQIAAGVQDINKQLEVSGRPYEIVEVSGGYRFRTRPEFGEMLASIQPERRIKLSRASLDTLAVIAYRQPISRPEVEEIRSVDSGAVVRALLERGLVRIVGRRDAPGRPALYGTTAQFLEVFGLGSLRDLPDLRDLVAPGEVEATPIEAAIAEQRVASSSEESEVEPAAGNIPASDSADVSSGEPEAEEVLSSGDAHSPGDAGSPRDGESREPPGTSELSAEKVESEACAESAAGAEPAVRAEFAASGESASEAEPAAGPGDSSASEASEVYDVAGGELEDSDESTGRS